MYRDLNTTIDQQSSALFLYIPDTLRKTLRPKQATNNPNISPAIKVQLTFSKILQKMTRKCMHMGVKTVPINQDATRIQYVQVPLVYDLVSFLLLSLASSFVSFSFSSSFSFSASFFSFILSFSLTLGDWFRQIFGTSHQLHFNKNKNKTIF